MEYITAESDFKSVPHKALTSNHFAGPGVTAAREALYIPQLHK
jgi:hypothetical protein